MVSLGDFTFPEKKTYVTVRTREVLSQVRREITIHSLLINYEDLESLESDVELLEEQLDRFERREALLSIHNDRYFTGWRRDYKRFIEPKHYAATVSLQIMTDDRYERSIVEHVESLAIAASGQSIAVEQTGSGQAFGKYILTACGTLVHPQISDGTRSMSFQSTLATGDTLELDGDKRSAVKNATENVLHIVSGDFPMLSPGETTITYTDDLSSSHQGNLEITYKDLWA